MVWSELLRSGGGDSVKLVFCLAGVIEGERLSAFGALDKENASVAGGVDEEDRRLWRCFLRKMLFGAG